MTGVWFGTMSLRGVTFALVICAISRGLLHYIEQYMNHFIAFKILVKFRTAVFDKMRQLAPAKMEGAITFYHEYNFFESTKVIFI